MRDELQALLAHEIGHEYVWTERERAFQLADHVRLKEVEFVCDAIAIVTLQGLGMDVSRLITGLQKIGRPRRYGQRDLVGVPALRGDLHVQAALERAFASGYTVCAAPAAMTGAVLTRTRI